MTINAQVAAARQRLRDAGISRDESDLSARLLAEHALGWSRERLLTDGSAGEPAGFTARFEALVSRRARREPLHYIVGHREFWGLDFEVTPAVLIPRPETEILVEATLARIGASAAMTVADLCTGCGCVAIAIAHERPETRVIATDISEEALAIARRNAERVGVADRVEILRGDLVAPFETICDVIVANPPYVVAGARTALQPEVRDHEPDLALFGGDDGLRLVDRLIREAPPRIRSGGWLMFEFGLGQDLEVEEMITASPELTFVGVERDLQGIARTAIATRR